MWGVSWAEVRVDRLEGVDRGAGAGGHGQGPL